MKLVDGMKDEKLGSAILYCFTKGYGNVPMDLYNIVLPLLFNDTFRNEIGKFDDFSQCIKSCLKIDVDFINKVLADIKNMDDITNRGLGISLLNKDLRFEITDGIMSGSCNPSKILDLNEAIKLGEMLKNKSLDEVIEMLKDDFKIVFLDSETLGSDIDLTKLNKLGAVTIYPQTDTKDIPERIKDADVVITNKYNLNEAQLKDATKLKLICVTATGVNNIDLEYCKKTNITVCNVKGYSTNAVAQHTFALLLDLYNKNHYYHDYIASGNYASSSMFTHLGYSFNELANKTWGIVGMGDIGQKVASIAKAFDCNIQYYSTSGKNNQQPYKQVDFETLLKTSDIISIHAPLNKQTENLFNRDAFAKMKSSAYLINVGRGKIVNEKDLVEALKNYQLAGAGLDVFENEPFKDDCPLLQINDATKLIMTPHIAWAPIETRNRVIDEVCLNIEGFKHNKLRNVCTL